MYYSLFTNHYLLLYHLLKNLETIREKISFFELNHLSFTFDGFRAKPNRDFGVEEREDLDRNAEQTVGVGRSGAGQ